MTSDFKSRSIDTNLKVDSSSLKIELYPCRYEGVQNCHILQGPHQISEGSVATTKPGGGWRFEVRCIYLHSPRFHVRHVTCLIVGNGEIHQSAHENFHGEDHEVFPQNLQCSRTPRHFKNASKFNRLNLHRSQWKANDSCCSFHFRQLSVLCFISTYPNISERFIHPFPSFSRKISHFSKIFWDSQRGRVQKSASAPWPSAGPTSQLRNWDSRPPQKGTLLCHPAGWHHRETPKKTHFLEKKSLKQEVPEVLTLVRWLGFWGTIFDPRWGTKMLHPTPPQPPARSAAPHRNSVVLTRAKRSAKGGNKRALEGEFRRVVF